MFENPCPILIADPNVSAAESYTLMSLLPCLLCHSVRMLERSCGVSCGKNSKVLLVSLSCCAWLAHGTRCVCPTLLHQWSQSAAWQQTGPRKQSVARHHLGVLSLRGMGCLHLNGHHVVCVHVLVCLSVFVSVSLSLSVPLSIICLS